MCRVTGGRFGGGPPHPQFNQASQARASGWFRSRLTCEASHVSFVPQPEAATQLILLVVEATAAAG